MLPMKNANNNNAMGISPLGNSSLTRRQRDVLLLATTGMTNAQIANELGLSCRTVECHRAAIRQRLDLGNAADLTRYALQQGWIRGSKIKY